MDVNLADLVAAVGAALPDRCALVCDGERLSYPGLTARSALAASVAPACPTLRHVLITGRDPCGPAPRFPGGVTVADCGPDRLRAGGRALAVRKARLPVGTRGARRR